MSVGKERLTQVFRYLQALNERRYPPVRQINQHPFVLYLDDLPRHECVQYNTNGQVLTVTRPDLSSAPLPPAIITEWLSSDWKSTDVEPTHHEEHVSWVADNQQVEQFADDPDRTFAWDGWLQSWNEWCPVARLELSVERLYKRFYEQRAILERDGERLELVLGDGLLNWRLTEGGTHHPVLLKRVEIELDPVKAQISIIETASPVELYTSPLRGAQAVLPSVLAQLRAQAESSDLLHPLDTDATDDFLKAMATMLHPQGSFVGSTAIQGELDHPRIARRPALFVRSKAFGIAQCLEQILEDLPTREDLPTGLLQVVGIESPRPPEPQDPTPNPGMPDEDPGIFFTKPANVEQLRVVRALKANGAVLVQGPPGTGKTHTIGNLVGHLLAEGKSVLVTSHTTKALLKVREQVAPHLQPLCVSVLQSDRKSREKLEAQVQEIAERLAQSDGSMEASIGPLSRKRQDLIDDLVLSRAALLEARLAEVTPVAHEGEAISPIKAAKWVNTHRVKHGWIPGQIKRGAPLPLTYKELADLYQSNVTVSVEVEENFPATAPDLTNLPTPETFNAGLVRLNELRTMNTDLPAGLWNCAEGCTATSLSYLHSDLDNALQLVLGRSEPWRTNLMAAAATEHVHNWRKVSELVRATAMRAARDKPCILLHRPCWQVELDSDEVRRRCSEIEEHLRAGRRLSRAALLFHPGWKPILSALSVSGRAPSKAEHFEATRLASQLEEERANLRLLWNGLMRDIEGPLIPENEDSPEDWCQRLLDDVSALLEWDAVAWTPLAKRITEAGISIAKAISLVQPDTSDAGELKRKLRACTEVVLPGLLKISARLETRAGEADLRDVQTMAELMRESHGDVPLFSLLHHATVSEDSRTYSEIYAKLQAHLAKRDDVLARRTALEKLEASAPGWARSIRHRNGLFGQSTPPDDVQAAWKWAQISSELDKRAQVSIQALLNDTEEIRKDNEAVTTSLVESKAWSQQFKRVNLTMRQALIGFTQTLRKIGAGTGLRVPRLLLQAQEQMAASQKAVPVWIMPLSRVAEVFDLRKNRFDVVIIDEASQLDLTGLIALYMAREIVIVGDHEQVEPLAVGEKVENVQALIDEYLIGIPNAQLWDGRQSVYELGRASFKAIPLREHFRCVPEIIGFSNRLSYRGSILPLREDSAVQTRPFVVPYFVADALPSRRTNPREAETLVALLAAAIEQPEYSSCTFGAISMVGDDQSDQVRLIRSLALEHVGEAELEKRRFDVGNSAQFQGDERDVMMISIVDTPVEGQHYSRTQELFKKRYNVAASRARDQMWVLYSLDPNRDLKPQDLRRELIEFALNPNSSKFKYEELLEATESEFEKQVLRHLTNRGYRSVVPQFKVGAFRIDFVVSGDGTRAAVECDGDKFHTLDRLQEDISRQSTLERLGWRFVRIRGSEFYRDEQTTMERVYDALEALGIRPELPETVAADPDNTSDLLHRVKTRAAALLIEWDTTSLRPSAHDEDVLATPQDRQERDSGNGQPTAPSLDLDKIVDSSGIIPEDSPQSAPITRNTHSLEFTQSQFDGNKRISFNAAQIQQAHSGLSSSAEIAATRPGRPSQPSLLQDAEQRQIGGKVHYLPAPVGRTAHEYAEQLVRSIQIGDIEPMTASDILTAVKSSFPRTVFEEKHIRAKLRKAGLL